MQAIIPSLEEKDNGLLLERGMRSGLSGVEEILDLISLLVKLASGGMLYLYLTISELAVSRALVRENEGAQKPAYYISHTMNSPQTRYQRLEKLVLALFIILRKLKHYFQSFPITVLIEHPLRSIVENQKATGRISKRASELRSYRLKFEPRTVIKGQVLADFIADLTTVITGHTD